MTTPFISRADLGDFMGQDLTGNDMAGIALDTACETVRTFVRRQLNYVPDDEITLDGSGTDTLRLPEWPVFGDVTVTVDETATTDYVLQESRLVRTDGGCWARGISNVAVTYSHGYAVQEGDVADPGPQRVPSDLRQVALAIAAGLMSVSETRFHTVSPRDTVGGSAPVEGPAPAVLTEDQQRVLTNYKDYMVG
jgi:hypothetical protein